MTGLGAIRARSTPGLRTHAKKEVVARGITRCIMGLTVSIAIS